MLKRICVYCGSNSGSRIDYTEAAKEVAELFVEKEIELVYGGAHVGMMGVIANKVLQKGGRVTGVIPENLIEKEIAHNGLTELKVVSSMHERKAQLAELSDGFIALPGGFGTLDELFEILTWGQLGFHRKPVGILNSCGYFDHLTYFLDRAVSDQFLKPENRELLVIEEDPSELMARLERYRPKRVEKWL